MVTLKLGVKFVDFFLRKKINVEEDIEWKINKVTEEKKEGLVGSRLD